MELLSENSAWKEEGVEVQSLGLETVLVTGGTGLIGTSLQEVLGLEEDEDNAEFRVGDKEKWIFVGSNDGDLRSLQAVQSLFRKYKPTMVLHLAAKVGGLYTNMAHNLEFFRDNMAINDNVLNTAYETGVRKVVSCLSTCIFPDATTYPIDETMVHSGPPHDSNFGYSYAKRMIDILNRAFNQKLMSAEEPHRVFTSIVPCNIFGPWDNFDQAESHVIPGLIHKMYLANKRGESEYTILGSGTALRQFIYSRDLAKVVIGIMRKYEDPEPVILSVDEFDEVPVKAVADMIAKNFDSIKTINTDPSFPDGQFKKTANNTKLRKLFPDFQFTPLDKAIAATVKWFVSNYDNHNTIRLGSSGV